MKKSKFLLTLVVVLVLCSTLVALVACGGSKDDSAKITDKQKVLEKWGQSINKTLKFNNNEAIGLDYAVNVPVADVKVDGKVMPKTIAVYVKGLLDTANPENSRFQLSADEIVGKKDVTNVFTLVANDKDLFLTAGDTKYQFTDLGMADMLDGATLPDGESVSGILGAAVSLGGFAIKTAEFSNNTYKVLIDTPKLGGMVKTMLGGMIGQDVANKLGDLLTSITITMTTKVNDSNVIKQFNIDVITDNGPAHVIIKPAMGNKVRPEFNVPTDTASYVKTQLLNFSVDGTFRMGNRDTGILYTYDVDADIDVFCLLRNLAKYGVDDLSHLFDGSNTKLFVDVKRIDESKKSDDKDYAHSVVTIAMDPATMGTSDIVIAAKTNEILGEYLYKLMLSQSAAEEMMKPGWKVIKVDPVAIIADHGKRNSSMTEPVKEAPVGPALDLYEGENNTVTAAWEIEDASYTYHATVNGMTTAFVVADGVATIENIKSGAQVSVWYVTKDGVTSKNTTDSLSMDKPTMSVAPKKDAENKVIAGKAIVTITVKKVAEGADAPVYKITHNGMVISTPAAVEEKGKKVIKVEISDGDKIEVCEVFKDGGVSESNVREYKMDAPKVTLAVTEPYQYGMGIASWAPANNATYEVYLDGGLVDAQDIILTKEEDAKGNEYVTKMSVLVPQGQSARVVAVYPGGKVTSESTGSYSDKNTIIEAVKKGVSMLAGFDFDYETSEVVFNKDMVVKFVDALGFALGYGEGFGASVNAIYGPYDEFRISVGNNGGFFKPENHTMDVKANFETATGLKVADVAAETEFTMADKKNVVINNNGVSNYTASKPAEDGTVTYTLKALTKEELTTMLNKGNIVIDGKKVGKVIGLDWNSREVQDITIIIINNVDASADGLVEKLFGNYYVTDVLYTQIQITDEKPVE